MQHGTFRSIAFAAIVLLIALLVHADANTWPGTYSGGGMTVTLNLGSGGLVGYIVKGSGSFPCSAAISADGGSIKGLFTTGGQSFDFTASLSGAIMSLQTGGATYTLTKQADAVPAPGGNAAAAPEPSAAEGAPAGGDNPNAGGAAPGAAITGGSLPDATLATAEGTIPLGDANTPAPSWLAPGVRISMLQASASIANSDNELTPCNPGDEGAFYDDKTNQWYHEEQIPGVGGSGILETTVLAIDGHKAVLGQRSFLNLPGQLGFGNASWGATDIASAGDLWQSPALIAKASEVQGPPMWVMRMPYSLENGKQFNVLRIQVPHESMNFDVDTGLLIRESTQQQCGDLKYHYDNEAPRPGSLVLGQSTFLAERQMNYPWIGKPAPDWIKTVKSMRVEQDQVTYMQGVPPYAVAPVFIDITFKAHGDDWLAGSMALEQQQGDMPQVAPVGTPIAAGSAGGPGNLYLPPKGLQGLQPGQKLDADPVTNMTTTVTNVGPNQESKQIVEFTEEAPGIKIVNVYDAQTGMSIRYTRDVQTGPAVVETIFTVVGME